MASARSALSELSRFNLEDDDDHKTRRHVLLGTARIGVECYSKRPTCTRKPEASYWPPRLAYSDSTETKSYVLLGVYKFLRKDKVSIDHGVVSKVYTEYTL